LRPLWEGGADPQQEVTVLKHKQARRRFRLFLIVSAAALALVAAGSVISHAARSHEIDATLRVATVKSSGSNSIAAGYVTGKPDGKGAVILRNKATNNPDGTVTLTGKFTAYNKKGSFSGTGQSKVTPKPDGSLTAVGDAKITSGTGAYKGAEGSFDLAGSRPAGSSVSTLHGTGSVRY
jgi:hypothetical protein